MNELNNIEHGQRIDTIDCVLLDCCDQWELCTWGMCVEWEVKYVDADYIIICDDNILDYILINYKFLHTGNE
jgi:hypothetical protein